MNKTICSRLLTNKGWVQQPVELWDSTKKASPRWLVTYYIRLMQKFSAGLIILLDTETDETRTVSLWGGWELNWFEKIWVLWELILFEALWYFENMLAKGEHGDQMNEKPQVVSQWYLLLFPVPCSEGSAMMLCYARVCSWFVGWS